MSVKPSSDDLRQGPSSQVRRSWLVLFVILLWLATASVIVVASRLFWPAGPVVPGIVVMTFIFVVKHRELFSSAERTLDKFNWGRVRGEVALAGDDYFRQIDNLLKAVTANLRMEHAGEADLLAYERLAEIWTGNLLRLDAKRAPTFASNRYLHQFGVAKGAIQCIRDRRKASRLLGEAERSILLQRATLRKALLNVGNSEVTQEALTVELRGHFRANGPLADGPCTIWVKNRVAYIEVGVPHDNVARSVREVKQTKRGQVITDRPRPARDISREYRDEVTEFARITLRRAFTAGPGLEKVALSLFLPMTHATLGHQYRGCVLAVLADRPTWDRIIHGNVTAENALRNFDFRFRPDLDAGLLEVPAIPPPGGSQTEGTIFLQTIDPLEFERLVSELLSRMGYITQLTKSSHDGGIDVIAMNPQPLVGGKVVVQCKRYSGTVGSPIVRDLYGVVHSEQASKGVLITTSDFSPDAYSFAEGKPVELINGSKLTELLRQYGFSVS